ncbi:MAG: hypothetical protein K8H74_05940 [Notoacmeibacter sp.]|nr:hypothetical protein [Notoacmeibacter sp.]
MFRTILLACATTLALTVNAFAFHCPADMAKIDEALQTASLSESDLAKVKELRAQGEEEHNAGNHTASVETLAEAMKLLGI